MPFDKADPDIYTRKQSENKTDIKAQQEWKNIFRSIGQPAVILDPKHVIIEANQMALNAAGISEDYIIGRKCYEIFHSKECKTFPDECPLEKLLSTNRMETVEMEIVAYGGAFLVSCIPVFNDYGQLEKVIHIASNLSECKRTEEEKRNPGECLQRAEKMKALGTLAGGVAHDLNNVLGIIIGYADLLLHEVDKSSPIRLRLAKIMNGIEKASAMVQDLLTLARRGVSDRKVLNLNSLILDYQKSQELEQLSAYHPFIRINLDLEPELMNISGSSIHLGKTLSNLITNAAEAMRGGGNITIKTTNQYLDKPIQGYDNILEGDYVVLSVTDTGEGIASADLPHIFEPFYTKKVMGKSGSGLGLAVVWGTVKDHQGYINVQSEEGKGSAFTFYFPVTREEVTEVPVCASTSEYMGKDETILVVDDVRDQRDLASDMLKKLSYQVSSVASGEEAIEYLKKHQVDLMVLDMIMDPGMDGLEVYRKVLEINPKQKAIIVSGFSESERVKEAQALGAGTYIKKPYVMKNIGMAVKKELSRK